MTEHATSSRQPARQVMHSLLPSLPEETQRLLEHLCAPRHAGTTKTDPETLVASLRRRERDFRRERAAAPPALRRLLATSPPDRRTLLDEMRDEVSPSLCELLLQESRASLVEEPPRAEEMARLALSGAQSLDPESYGPGPVRDLEARALCHLGEALRHRQDLDGAERAYRSAAGVLDDGTAPPDLLERAHLLEHRARLLEDRRRFSESSRLKRRARVLLQRLGQVEHLTPA